MTNARIRPRLTTTHTCVILEISEAAFNEIHASLDGAGYQHAFHRDGGRLVIDMHGIAVAEEAPSIVPAPSPAALGGPWTAEDHAAHPSFDEPLARAMVGMFRPEGEGWICDGNGARVIDFGGGLGLYLDGFLHEGAVTVLVEPMVFPATRRHTVIAVDMSEPMSGLVRLFSPDGYLDVRLTLCLETMEHIPRDRHASAIDNVCRTVAPGGWLVFSAATPGQGGHGHVAERPEEEWREELAARGLVEDAERTAGLRAVATLPWFKANLMCWRRPAEGEV